MVNMDDVNEITYRFIDASVPPQYHRSYTITVSTSRANVVVDSYGKILVEKTYEIPKSEFNSLLNSFQKNKIRNCSMDEGDGCTGGTGEKISVFDSKKEVFSGQVYRCGGEDYGNMCGDISAFAEVVKMLVSDFEELVK